MGTKKPNFLSRARKRGAVLNHVDAQRNARSIDESSISPAVKSMVNRRLIPGRAIPYPSRNIGHASFGTIKVQVQVHAHNDRGASKNRTSQKGMNPWSDDHSRKLKPRPGDDSVVTPWQKLPHLSSDQHTSSYSGTASDDVVLCTYDSILTSSITPFERESYFQLQRKLGRKIKSPIDLLISDRGENTVPSYAIEELHKICPPFSLAEIRREQVDVPEPRSNKNRAWIDDRCFAPRLRPGHREHPNPVTASQIYRIQQKQRAGGFSHPDADRRLV